MAVVRAVFGGGVVGAMVCGYTGRGRGSARLGQTPASTSNLSHSNPAPESQPQSLNQLPLGAGASTSNREQVLWWSVHNVDVLTSRKAETSTVAAAEPGAAAATSVTGAVVGVVGNDGGGDVDGGAARAFTLGRSCAYRCSPRSRCSP